MTLLVVLATGASIFVGSRAIVSAASTLKSSGVPEAAESDQFDVAGEQVADLLRDLNPPPAVSVEPDTMRDPMRAAAPQRRADAPAVPRPPTYTVTAVFIDADPTAIVVSRGKTMVVRLGDRLNGALIKQIDAKGVTVDTGGGSKLYPLIPKK
jgi:hypothetical protein